MRRCAKLIGRVIFIFVMTQCAAAQTVQNGDKDGGWVVAAYLGAAHTGASDLTISQPTLGNNITFERVRFRSQSFDRPLYYGLD